MLRRPISIWDCRSSQGRRGQNHQQNDTLQPRQVAFHINEVEIKPKPTK